MKTKFNILSASLVGVVCASIMTPSFAASSVRSLGGTGTYTGTSSVRSNTATATSGSAVSAARAGSIRIGGGTTATKTNTGASLRTPSTRSATAPRLSIGKYLAGSSALGGSSTGGDINVGTSGITTDIEKIKEGMELLKAEVDRIAEDDEITVDLTFDEKTGVLSFQHGDETPIELNLYAPQEEALKAFDDKLNAFQQQYAPSPKLELNSTNRAYIDLVEEEEDGKKVQVLHAIIGSLENGALTKGLATVDDVNNYVTEYVPEYVESYAIPKPADKCVSESSVCVLSVKNVENADGTQGVELVWLDLVDQESETNTQPGLDIQDDVPMDGIEGL